MTNPVLAFEQQLSALRDAYAQQLPDKMNQILQTWRQLILGYWTEEGLKSVYRQVHSLSGSGGTYGFPAVSDAARNLEDQLRPFLESNSMPSNAELLKINGLVAELRKACAQPDQTMQKTQRGGKLLQFAPSRRS